MTTNETTARDRVIGVGAVALAHHVNDRAPDDGAYDLATVVVDALLAHPQMLRALVAAPDGHVCRPPALDRVALVEAHRRWDCPVDGIRWVLVKRMVGRRMHGEWRRMLGQPAPDVTSDRAAVVEPDYVEDGVQGWLVGAGLDVERDDTGAAPTIRIGGAEQSVQRVRALRDALSAALDGDTEGER